MIELTNISYCYKKESVLSDLNLTVRKGEIVVLCGPSGSGKSTFIKMMSGMIPEIYGGNFTGSGHVASQTIGSPDFSEFVRQIGLVFQNPKRQFMTSDVLAELAFGMENSGVPVAEMQARIAAIAEKLAITPLLKRTMFALSGGQKQLLAFAICFVMNPDLYLLDEPSSNLDEAAIRQLSHYLLELKTAGKTVVIVEHRLNYLMAVTDRLLLLEKGHLLAEFTPAELQQLSIREVANLGLRSVAAVPLAPKKSQRRPLVTKHLAGRHLHFHYKKQAQVIDIAQIDFSNQAITGITGKNGAGKSTLVQLLCGLLKVKGGEILFNGVPQKRQDLIQKSFIVMQDPNLQLFFETVAKELQQSQATAQEMNKIVELLDLGALLTRHPQSLSGGEKQRVAIATALLSGKEILFFDEPTSGLDYKRMQAVSALIKKVAQTAITIVISHDYEFLNATVNRVITLENGKIESEL